MEIPDREILNKMFQRLSNYKKMAEELGVGVGELEKWMGSIEYMRNPGLREGADEKKIITRKISKDEVSRVKELYRTKKYHQNRIAEIVGRDPGTVSRMLKGTKKWYRVGKKKVPRRSVKREGLPSGKDRKVYFREYYKRYVLTDPGKIEERRRRAREYAKKHP